MTDHVPSGADRPAGPKGKQARGGLREVWRAWRTAPEDRFEVLLFFVVMTIVLSSVVDVGASYG